MKADFKILICVILIALPGCQSNKSSRDATLSLTSAKWSFLGVRHTDTNILELVPPSLKSMDVVFTGTKTLQANSSCNIFYGDFVTSGSNSIKIDNLSMTKMFCPEDTVQLWESRYFDGLKSSEKYDIKGDSLIISTGSKFAMIFKTN
jgi:heat shock protein HslJ